MNIKSVPSRPDPADCVLKFGAEETRRAVERYRAALACQDAAYVRYRAECPKDASLEEDQVWVKWTDTATCWACDAKRHLLQTIQTWRGDIEAPHYLDHLGTELRHRGVVIDGILYLAVIDEDEPKAELVVIPMADVVNLDD